MESLLLPPLLLPDVGFEMDPELVTIGPAAVVCVIMVDVGEEASIEDANMLEARTDVDDCMKITLELLHDCRPRQSDTRLSSV